jgi:ankyrin repeat protein
MNNYALRYSAENGHLDIVKYLIEHGADKHADDDHAFRYSEKNGHEDVAKYLCDSL